jgi:putative transposase
MDNSRAPNTLQARHCAGRTIDRGLCVVRVIERLWRSLKYECVYLHAFETGSELRAGLSRWIGYYNARRPHSSLCGQTPDEAHAMGADNDDRLARLAA